MTQIKSEATQESVVTADKPAEHLWCIQCEAWVKVETFNCGLGHLKITETLGEDSEIDFCCFPMGHAFCPPQEEVADLSEDWMEQPDDELPGEEIEIWLGGME